MHRPLVQGSLATAIFALASCSDSGSNSAPGTTGGQTAVSSAGASFVPEGSAASGGTGAGMGGSVTAGSGGAAGGGGGGLGGVGGQSPAPKPPLVAYAQHEGAVQPLSIDRVTGAATPLGMAVPVCNEPIHLQVAVAGDRLMAACNASGGVAVLGIDRATGALTLLGFAEGSGDAVHVGVHPSGEFVLSSDYGEQSFVTLYRLDAQGRPSRLQSLELDSYMHSARFSASGQYVYAASQGSNRIWQLAFDAENEQLAPLQPEAVMAITDEPGGSEPRHVLPSPDGKLLYATGQKPPVLLTFEIDAASGKLSKRGSGLPLFAGVADGNCCGKDLIITQKGDWIFASAWGVDRLSAFTVAAGGTPARDSVAASGGLGAQSVALDPEGEFLFVMHDGEQAGLSLFRLVGGTPTFVNRVPGLVGQGVAAVVLD